MLIRQFFAALTILCFTLTQVLPAWALERGGWATLRPEMDKAGLEEALLQRGPDQGIGELVRPLSPSVVPAEWGIPSGDVPLAFVRVEKEPPPSASTPSARIVAGESNIREAVSLAEGSGWLWIDGVTHRDGRARLFGAPHRFYWPVVQGLQKRPDDPRVSKYMQSPIPDLERAIQDGVHGAAAAALLRGCAFCATRGEAPTLQPTYDPNEPPLPLDTVAEMLETTGISNVLDSDKPVYLLEEEEPQEGQVILKKVVRGAAEDVPIPLTPEEHEQVSQYLRELSALKGQRLQLEKQRMELERKRNELEKQRAEMMEKETDSGRARQEWKRIEKELRPLKEELRQLKGPLRQLKEDQRVLPARRREIFQGLVAGHLGAGALFQNALFDGYAGGQQAVDKYLQLSWDLKRFSQFSHLFRDAGRRNDLRETVRKLEELIRREEQATREHAQRITSLRDQEIVRERLVKLKDIAFNLRNDVLGNVERVEGLDSKRGTIPPATLRYLWSLTMLLNGVDYRMETRGRDSLGVSIMATLPNERTFKGYLSSLNSGVQGSLRERSQIRDLGDGSVIVRLGYDEKGQPDPKKPVTLTFVYKVAEVVGFLGDNAKQLRKKMVSDDAFQELLRQPLVRFTAVLHSRWASAGTVSVPNAHPVDNRGLYKNLPPGDVAMEYGLIQVDEDTVEIVAQLQGVAPTYGGRMGTILAVLNGDIENYNSETLKRTDFYPDLLKEYRGWKGPWSERRISDEISTDTKLIPLRIEHYLGLGYTLLEAVRRAARDFDGSFAIQVQSDLEPGKIFLATNGSGQGLYVGISPDGFHPASESYGFVDVTQRFVRVRPGQLIVIDQALAPTIENLKAYDFDGNEIRLGPEDVEPTVQTTRDVYLLKQYDRYFVKEVSEAGEMFRATVMGKVSTRPVPAVAPGVALGEEGVVHLSEEEFPGVIAEELRLGQYRRIVFIAMGTAHAAAEAVARTLKDYLSMGKPTHPVEVEARLAPDFQGFGLQPSMADTLVVVVSQSGKTADTNQVLEECIKRRARPLGIINARESDAAFLIQDGGGGVIFTGTGRDIEIAVASTKAYYAQIAAGTILAMRIAQALGIPPTAFVEDIKELQRLPDKMNELVQAVTQSKGQHPLIRAAEFFPLFKSEWAVVGSGPGEVAAHEAVIKLSELCYRCFFATPVENLKHVNFSAEPWVLVLAANVHGIGDFVQQNLPGEISKMLSHTLAVSVVTTEGDHRFDTKKVQYRDAQGRKQERPVDIISVPTTTERFAPIFLTMSSHLLAYYIALAMNRRGQMLHDALAKVVKIRRELEAKGRSGPEILYNPQFRQVVEEGFGEFYSEVRKGIFNTGVRPDQAVEVATLIPFLRNDMSLDSTEEYLGESISATAVMDRFEESVTTLAKRQMRTIDTIAHQAKYVTVGIKPGGRPKLGDVAKFVGHFRERNLHSQVLLELVQGYQAYWVTEQPWVEAIPDPEAPLERSLLLTVTRTEELAAEAVASLDSPLERERIYSEPYVDGEETMTVSVFRVARPLPALQTLRVADQVRQEAVQAEEIHRDVQGVEALLRRRGHDRDADVNWFRVAYRRYRPEEISVTEVQPSADIADYSSFRAVIPYHRPADMPPPTRHISGQLDKLGEEQGEYIPSETLFVAAYPEVAAGEPPVPQAVLIQIDFPTRLLSVSGLNLPERILGYIRRYTRGEQVPVSAEPPPTLLQRIRSLAAELVQQFDSSSGVYFASRYEGDVGKTLMAIVGPTGVPGLVDAITGTLADAKISLERHGDLPDHGDISYVVVQGRVDEAIVNQIREKAAGIQFGLEMRARYPLLTWEQTDDIFGKIRGIQRDGGVIVEVSPRPYPATSRAGTVFTVSLRDFPEGDARRGQVREIVERNLRQQELRTAGEPLDETREGVRILQYVVDNLPDSPSVRAVRVAIEGEVEGMVSAGATLSASPAIGQKEEMVAILRSELESRGLYPREIEWFLNLYRQYHGALRLSVEEDTGAVESFIVAVAPYAGALPSDLKERLRQLVLTGVPDRKKAEASVSPVVSRHTFDKPHPLVLILISVNLTGQELVDFGVVDGVEKYLTTSLAAGMEEGEITPEIQQAAAARGWAPVEVSPGVTLFQTRQGGWVSPNAVLGIGRDVVIADGAWVRGSRTKVGDRTRIAAGSFVEDAEIGERCIILEAVIRTDDGAKEKGGWWWSKSYGVPEITVTRIGNDVAVVPWQASEPPELVNVAVGDKTVIRGSSLKNSEIGGHNLIVRAKVGLTHTEDNVTIQTLNGAPTEVSESWLGWGRTIDSESYNEHLSPNLIRRAYVDTDGSVKFETVEEIPAVVMQGYSVIDASYDASGKPGKEFNSSRHGKGVKFPGAINGPRVNVILMVHQDFDDPADFLRAESFDRNARQGHLTALHPFSYSVRAVRALDRTAREVWGQVLPGASRRGLSEKQSDPLWVFEHAPAAIQEIVQAMHRQVDRHADTVNQDPDPTKHWDVAKRAAVHAKVDNLPRYALETGKALARLAGDKQLEARYDAHLARQGSVVENLKLEDLLATDEVSGDGQDDWADKPLFTDADRATRSQLSTGVQVSPDSQLGEGARVIGARASLKGVTIPAGATVYVHGSVVEGATLNDGARVLGSVIRGGLVESGVQVTNGRVEGSSLGSGAQVSGAVITGSAIGPKSTIEPYARIANTQVGRKGIVGSIVSNSEFGDAITSRHLVGTRVDHVRTPNYEVEGVSIPNLTNISSGARARGTADQPITLLTTMTGANMEIGPGAMAGFGSFVKNELGAGEQVAPFAFSAGPGDTNKQAGLPLKRMHNTVMRITMGKTLKEMNPADYPAFDRLVQEQMASADLAAEAPKWQLDTSKKLAEMNAQTAFANGKWVYEPSPDEVAGGSNQGHGRYVWQPAGLEEQTLDRREAIRRITGFVEGELAAGRTGVAVTAEHRRDSVPMIASGRELAQARKIEELVDFSAAGSGEVTIRFGGAYGNHITIRPVAQAYDKPLPELRPPETRESTGLEEVDPAALRAERLPQDSASVATDVTIIAGPHITGLALGAALSKVTTPGGRRAAQVVFVVEDADEAEVVSQLAVPVMVFSAADYGGSVEAALDAARAFHEGATELGTDNEPVPESIQLLLRNLFGIEINPDVELAAWKDFIRRATLAIQA